MIGLERMLHLRGSRCTGHAMMSNAPKCFVDADIEPKRGQLMALAARGDLPAQRIAAICLGHLPMGIEDPEIMKLLKDLCGKKNKAVQAAGLKGLGMAAKSTCDEQIRSTCLTKTRDPETIAPALGALGMVFLGSGRSDVFAGLAEIERRLRSQSVRGHRHCKPLAACYPAVGMLYMGTGSEEPLEFLLDAISRPAFGSRYAAYRKAAARALVMIEFPESVENRPRSQKDRHGASWLTEVGAVPRSLYS